MANRTRKIVWKLKAPSYIFRSRPGRAEVRDALLKKRNEWNLSQDQIDTAAEIVVLDRATKKVLKDELRLFLYAKWIFFDKGKLCRIEQYDILLDPGSSGLSSWVISKLKKGRERLRIIVKEGEASSNLNCEIPNMFQEFVEKHPEWSSENSFVFFRDHLLLRDKPSALVERVQVRGLCYMQAPIVLQHYLVAMRSKEHVPVLDVDVYLRQFMGTDALINQIWNDQGSDSKMFLLNILLQIPEPMISSMFSVSDLRGAMAEYGPGLVQGFQVEDSFMHSDDWQHLGSRVGAPLGLHAMVLVGHRKEGDADRFLFQNWWKTKPFVEVDAEYLKTCRGVIHFVETPQPEIRSFVV